nr:uncharacterized protein LOC121124395 [Lepeophtheirus salmonis]
MNRRAFMIPYSPSPKELYPSLSQLTLEENIIIQNVIEKDRLFREYLSQDENSDLDQNSFKKNSSKTRHHSNTYTKFDRNIDYSYVEDYNDLCRIPSRSKSVGEENIDISLLNDEEKYQIYQVLWKDNLLQHSNEEKIRGRKKCIRRVGEVTLSVVSKKRHLTRGIVFMELRKSPQDNRCVSSLCISAVYILIPPNIFTTARYQQACESSGKKLLSDQIMRSEINSDIAI